MSNLIKKPFFIFNPKSYLYGEELYQFVEIAEELAKKYEGLVSILVTGPFADLSNMAKLTNKAYISAQHMDSIDLGRGMGYITAESLKEIGVKATFLNHAEHQMTLGNLIKAIKRAKDNNIATIVCADSLDEAKIIARLNPDVILCEPTDLIGTGEVSDESYIKQTNDAIRQINLDILVMQAAGISTPDDVYRTIKLGADGTGCTSGIVKAENPKQMFIDMVDECIRAMKERK